MKKYLRLMSDPTQFSDLADYLTEVPFSAPDGFEWIEGEPPLDAELYVELSLINQLNALFEGLAPEVQADLAPLKAAVKLELEQNRNTIARLIIERAQIPAELETTRQSMLSLFEAP